jgi:hypothetical protein
MHPITQRSPSLFGNDLCWGETIYVLHIYKSWMPDIVGYGVPMGCQSGKQNPWEPAAWIASCCSPASHETVSMDWHVLVIIHNV